MVGFFATLFDRFYVLRKVFLVETGYDFLP